MYETGSLLPIDSIPDGSVVLCSGPPMVGKRNLVLALLAQGVERGETAVVVSTDDGHAAVQRDLTALVGDGTDGRIGIVDAAGNPDTDPPEFVRNVNSPTDLTGIGIEFSNLLGARATQSGTRIGVLSLSTLFLYSEPNRVLRFLHVLGQRVREINGVAFVVVHDEGLDPEVSSQIQAFVDASIDVRETDGVGQYRVRGLDTSATEWVDLPDVQDRLQQEAVDASTPPASNPEATPSLDSLRDLLLSVTASKPTLTLVNYTGDSQALDTIDTHFDRLNVAVRTTETELSTPTDVALLHRDEDLLASTSVPDLLAAIDITEDDGLQKQAQTTALLDAIDKTTYGARGADKRFLVQVSHTIEMLATRTGRGRIHAGFQELSRLVDDPRARRIYERLAERGVDVHIYGVPDTDLPDTDWTVHPADEGELSTTWFVGFTAPGTDRAGVLVAEEHEDGYDSFWSYRQDLSEQLDEYLRASY